MEPLNLPSRRKLFESPSEPVQNPPEPISRKAMAYFGIVFFILIAIIFHLKNQPYDLFSEILIAPLYCLVAGVAVGLNPFRNKTESGIKALIIFFAAVVLAIIFIAYIDFSPDIESQTNIINSFQLMWLASNFIFGVIGGMIGLSILKRA